MKSKFYPFYWQPPYIGYCPNTNTHTHTLLQKKFNTFSIIFQKSQPPINKGAPVAVLLMRWMWGTFEFDQLYKQTGSKMQVT